MDPALAIDAVRVLRLRAVGYRVRTQLIPAAITPKNRLVLAERAHRDRDDDREPPAADRRQKIKSSKEVT
jgi:hypothetical protein